MKMTFIDQDIQAGMDQKAIVVGLAVECALRLLQSPTSKQSKHGMQF